MNKAATNIEDAREPVCRGDCAKWLWSRQRPHFRLQRLDPGRNPSCTEPLKSELKESANGSVARGVLFAAFVSASVTTLTLTQKAFSWKPFGRVTHRIG